MRDTPLDPRLRTASSQVQVRLVGQRREAVEAALLQTTGGLQVVRGPRRGRKGDYLAYATLTMMPEGMPEQDDII